MAVKTFYFLNTTATAPNWFGSMQDGGTPPANVVTTAGFNPGKTAVTTPFYRGRWGATAKAATAQAASYIASTSGPAKGTGSGATTAGDSFVTPAAYTGTFAAGAWTLDLSARPSTVTLTGRWRMRVWASVNADGTSARELTSGALVGSINTMSSTSTTYAAGLTWSPGAITLNNEYLFFQIEWEETTAGSANGSANGLYLGVADITTTDFVPPATSDGVADADGIGAASAVSLCVKPADGDADAIGAANATSLTIVSAVAAASGVATSSVVGEGGAQDLGTLVTNEAWSPLPPILLLHCDGANASTSFPDAVGGHTVTPIGAAQIDTSQSVFGGASAKLGSASDYLQLDGASDLAIGTSDFQFDCRVRFNNSDTYELIDWGGSGPTLKIGADGKLVYQIGGVDKINGSTVLAADTQYHVAVARVAGTTRLWLDGAQEGSDYVASDNITISANRPTIGTRS